MLEDLDAALFLYPDLEIWINGGKHEAGVELGPLPLKLEVRGETQNLGVLYSDGGAQLIEGPPCLGAPMRDHPFQVVPLLQAWLAQEDSCLVSTYTWVLAPLQQARLTDFLGDAQSGFDAQKPTHFVDQAHLIQVHWQESVPSRVDLQVSNMEASDIQMFTETFESAAPADRDFHLFFEGLREFAQGGCLFDQAEPESLLPPESDEDEPLGAPLQLPHTEAHQSLLTYLQVQKAFVDCSSPETYSYQDFKHGIRVDSPRELSLTWTLFVGSLQPEDYQEELARFVQKWPIPWGGLFDFLRELAEFAQQEVQEPAPEEGEYDAYMEDLRALRVKMLQKFPNLGDRPLGIISWGRALLKRAPLESQRNFNASVLTGTGGGPVNLKILTGKDPPVQRRVMSAKLFFIWMENVVRIVETENLMCISTNCTKGRHRSVAAAELLRVFYPKATCVHQTWRK